METKCYKCERDLLDANGRTVTNVVERVNKSEGLPMFTRYYCGRCDTKLEGTQGPAWPRNWHHLSTYSVGEKLAVRS